MTRVQTLKADTLKARVLKLSEPIAEELGLRLYDVNVVRANRLVIRITAERRSKASSSDRITVSDCASLSRQIEETLDLEALIPSRYALEVSSPGLERVLKSPGHFAGALGETVRITTTSLKKNEGIVEGVLVSADESEVVVEHQTGRVPLRLSEIRRATTVYRG